MASPATIEITRQVCVLILLYMGYRVTGALISTAIECAHYRTIRKRMHRKVVKKLRHQTDYGNREFVPDYSFS